MKKYLPRIFGWVGLSLALVSRPASADLSLAIASQATNSLLTWSTNLPNTGLQFTTDLGSTNWTTIGGATIIGNVYTMTQSLGSQSVFFRLIHPCGETNSPPRLRDGQYITFTRAASQKTLNITNAASAVVNQFQNTFPATFDASQFFDPQDCNSTTNDLKFHWAVSYPPNTGVASPFTDVGITGYRSPILQIQANALIVANPVTFTLTVTARNPPFLSTTVTILSQVSGSQLTLTIFNQCAKTVTCPTCDCSIAAALPTDEPTTPEP